jgi:predicted RNase H-like HicB family nuclease
MTLKYRIIIEWSEADKAYIAQVPALGCKADGPSPQKAVQEILVVAGMFLESMAEDGDPIPPPEFYKS